jgi:hypothetical protein
MGEGTSELGVDLTSLVIEAHPLEDTMHNINSAPHTNQNPAPVIRMSRPSSNLFDFTDEGSGAHVGVETIIVALI